MPQRFAVLSSIVYGLQSNSLLWSMFSHRARVTDQLLETLGLVFLTCNCYS